MSLRTGAAPVLAGGDRFHDTDPAVTASGAASVDSGVLRTLDTDNRRVRTPYGSAGHGYGPVDPRYAS